MPTKRFQVALSFAGEHRAYVLKVAEHLAAKIGKDAVFYDNWHKHQLARPNLSSYIQNIYHENGLLIVPFLCVDYQRKEWCGLEWRAIQDLIKKRQYDNIMPLRFDDTEIEGFFSIDGYLDLRQHTESETAELILKRLENLQLDITLPSQPRIYSNRLPTTLGKFFGREPELKLLDNALTDQQTAIVQFVASGGTGKTKLLQHWLERHSDMPVLIAWSFYSQGASEDKQTTASPFFEHLFYKFAVTPPVFPSEADKGEYAAELLMRQPCVLVLDGLEPLQHAGKGMRGELKDRAVRALLKRLASQSTVLCVITTRIAAPELNGQTVQTHSLHNLEKADGVRLLRDLGVKGTYTELETAVTDYGQHALAIYLLGNLLVRFLGGDIKKRDQLGELLEEDGEPSSRHAFKVMQAYADWFKDCTELNILMLLGLFDHPIDKAVATRKLQGLPLVSTSATLTAPLPA